ncbi:hypothetical protein [Hamadaea tsunoensis]|uniref:hypothetical protein n=1 Tax=Hamadaea tsunoensis TaxID=53368 RepID=UPI000421C11B|nr:hypothetical protein [Hamadaea tsunoensis]
MSTASATHFPQVRPATEGRSPRDWIAPLFPDTPAAVPHAWHWPAGVLLVLGGAAASLLRVNGHGAWDSIWAQDASVYLSDALTRSPAAALTTPVGGFLPLVPRLLAEVATLFPVEWAAAVASTLAALVTSALALLVYVASSAHLSWRLSRVLVAAPLVLAPIGQGRFGPDSGSVIDNLATLQFPLLYATFWLLLWSPVRIGPRIAAGLVVAGTALTTPYALLLLPLAALRIAVRRDVHGILLAGYLAVGAVLQFVTFALAGGAGGTLRPNPVWALGEYARWLVPHTLFGERWEAQRSPWGYGIASLTILALALAAALVRLTKPRWQLAIAAATTSVVLASAELMTLGATADRYLYAPGLLLIAALAALLAPRPDPLALAPAGVLALILAVVSALNWFVPNHRSAARSWAVVVAEARMACDHSDGGRLPVDLSKVAPVGVPETGGGEVSVKTHPSGWRVTIPCRDLT